MEKETWFGVYDKLTKKIIYLYKDQISAINQAKRGTQDWVIVIVECIYDTNKSSKVHCCCNHSLTKTIN